jgi:oligoribonuclease (3'-5' exoribonuclease)
MADIVFVDTETTGLNPWTHEIWEVAVVRFDTTTRERRLTKTWQLPVDVETADPVALEINKFHERRWDDDQLTSLVDFTVEFASWFLVEEKTHWGGMIPSFDERRISEIFREVHGTEVEFPWHYHLIDVESMVLGYINGRAVGTDTEPHPMAVSPPWRSDVVTEGLKWPAEIIFPGGPEIPVVDEALRHTALGDAVWAADIYKFITN